MRPERTHETQETQKTYETQKSHETHETQETQKTHETQHYKLIIYRMSRGEWLELFKEVSSSDAATSMDFPSPAPAGPVVVGLIRCFVQFPVYFETMWIKIWLPVAMFVFKF